MGHVGSLNLSLVLFLNRRSPHSTAPRRRRIAIHFGSLNLSLVLSLNRGFPRSTAPRRRRIAIHVGSLNLSLVLSLNRGFRVRQLLVDAESRFISSVSILV